MLNFIEKKKKNYSIIAFVVYGEAIFVQYTQTHSAVKRTHCVEVEKKRVDDMQKW